MELYQVTSSKFGAFDVSVSPDKSQIVFSDYTSTGYNLGKMVFDVDRFQKTLPFKNREETKVNKQKKFVFNQDSIPDTEYEITSYKRDCTC